VIPVLASIALGSAALPAAAAPVIQSYASAESSESGEDPGFESDGDFSDQAGHAVTAGSSRCPGPGSCASQPGTDFGAHATALTNFGVNRASSHGNSGPENVENDVVDSASAGSFWADEWTFDVAPANAGDAVLLEFRIDGSWGNNGYARFDVLVGTPSNDPRTPRIPTCSGEPRALTGLCVRDHRQRDLRARAVQRHSASRTAASRAAASTRS
jgi:hypothetical protein